MLMDHGMLEGDLSKLQFIGQILQEFLHTTDAD
jgi:hypothetical protein